MQELLHNDKTSAGLSGQMHQHTADLSAAAPRFDHFDPDGPSQRSFENRLLGRAGAFALEIVWFRGTVLRRRALAAVLRPPVLEMNHIALALDIVKLLIGLDQLVDVTLSGGGDILLELVALEAGAPASLDDLHLGIAVDDTLHGVEQIGGPVLHELLLALDRGDILRRCCLGFRG